MFCLKEVIKLRKRSCLIKVLKFYFGYYKKDENILPSNF
jgi:hypothetical protein